MPVFFEIGCPAHTLLSCVSALPRLAKTGFAGLAISHEPQPLLFTQSRGTRPQCQMRNNHLDKDKSSSWRARCLQETTANRFRFDIGSNHGFNYVPVVCPYLRGYLPPLNINNPGNPFVARPVDRTQYQTIKIIPSNDLLGLRDASSP